MQANTRIGYGQRFRRILPRRSASRVRALPADAQNTRPDLGSKPPCAASICGSEDVGYGSNHRVPGARGQEEQQFDKATDGHGMSGAEG